MLHKESQHFFVDVKTSAERLFDPDMSWFFKRVVFLCSFMSLSFI